MREILFRGKRLDNGEWVDGNFYESGISGAYILQNVTRKTMDARTGKITMRDDPAAFEIRLSTVGQYTGLHDATKWENLPEKEQQEFLRNHKKEDWNGKRIFEGDILESHYGDEFPDDTTIEVIEWFNNGWCAHDVEHMTYEAYGLYQDNVLSLSEVIGNIHDNPELLKIYRGVT